MSDAKFLGLTTNELAKLASDLDAENAKLRNEVDNLLDFEHLTSVAVAYAGCDECGEYKQTMLRLFAENAKLREQTELLVTLLRNDCDIEASWDGLRHFWSIGLTEDGCLMRDRACKAEAENTKLRKENDTLTRRIDELCMENEELKARNVNQMKLLENCHEELIGWHEVARLVQSKIDEFEVTTDGS